MNDLFESGIKKGIEDCGMGLEAYRIDQTEHNKNIANEIVFQIKRSKFLVADFTCSDPLQKPDIRAGVYYEAGLAHGFGLDVFFCCHKDQFGDIHFDIKQYNFILWKDAADLKKALSARIRAMLALKSGRA